MATIEQSEDFTRFVRELPDDKRSRSSIDELYDQWREQSRADEDLLAVQESLDDFKQGDRGRPGPEVMAGLRAEINSSKDR